MLMALAIRMDGLIPEKVVTDQTELARVGQVTKALMTQIMNLLNLAPDIQEAILFLPQVTSGKPPITERHLRPIAAELSWVRQRSAWVRVGGDINPTRPPEGVFCRELEHKLLNVVVFSTEIEPA
jgi:hypothetical protein